MMEYKKNAIKIEAYQFGFISMLISVLSKAKKMSEGEIESINFMNAALIVCQPVYVKKKILMDFYGLCQRNFDLLHKYDKENPHSHLYAMGVFRIVKNEYIVSFKLSKEINEVECDKKSKAVPA